MKWSKRQRLLLIAGILLPFVLLSGYLAYLLFVQERYVVATLDAGSRREIRIWGDRYIENCQPLYYEVRVDGRVVSPLTFIDCKYREPTFRLLYSKERNLVGVIEDERPEVILAINDFDSGETWPAAKAGDSWEAKLRIGRRLKDRLGADNPQLKLKLSDEAP
jgi:hypothetical protein